MLIIMNIFMSQVFFCISKKQKEGPNKDISLLHKRFKIGVLLNIILTS